VVVVERARGLGGIGIRQTGTGSTNHNTDCCVGGIMVVDVASDALLDSPGRLFWPIVIVESSRGTHTCPTPVQGPSAPSFCSPRCRLISLTLVRARPVARLTDRSTALHYYYSYYSCSCCRTALPPDYFLQLLQPSPHAPCRRSPTGIHFHTPRNTSGSLTVDHHRHRHIDLIRFSEQTFSLSDYSHYSKPATIPEHTIVTATC
jgi:hypothetical protein